MTTTTTSAKEVGGGTGERRAPCCDTCPFSTSAEAEQAQNWGCLPTRHDIVDLAKATGRPWGCHGDESRTCAGYAAQARAAGLPTRGRPLSYREWYHDTAGPRMPSADLRQAGATPRPRVP